MRLHCQLCLDSLTFASGRHTVVPCSRCSSRFSNIQYIHRRLVLWLYLRRNDFGCSSIPWQGQPRSTSPHHANNRHSQRCPVREDLQRDCERGLPFFPVPLSYCQSIQPEIQPKQFPTYPRMPFHQVLPKASPQGLYSLFRERSRFSHLFKHSICSTSSSSLTLPSVSLPRTPSHTLISAAFLPRCPLASGELFQAPCPHPRSTSLIHTATSNRSNSKLLLLLLRPRPMLRLRLMRKCKTSMPVLYMARSSISNLHLKFPSQPRPRPCTANTLPIMGHLVEWSSPELPSISSFLMIWLYSLIPSLFQFLHYL